MRITKTITLNAWELVEIFKQASGPGGQHVNKVATAVELRFDVKNSPSLRPVVKARLIKLAGARANKQGVIIIEAKSRRSQAQNRAEARARLMALIQKALTPPKPRKKTAIPTRARRQRLINKKKRGEIKSLRRDPPQTE